MNQAQALLSVDFRILRTISLNENFFIFDIAYSGEGTICLSVIKQAYVTEVFIRRNDVKFVLPTGSYITYRHMQFHYIEDNIVKTHSFPKPYLKLESPKLFQNNVSENLFQTHGIAVCKSGLILICQWNRRSRDQSAGKIVKLWHIEKNSFIIMEIDSDKNQPLYVCPTYITENGNGDICVSDVRAVVVTDAGGMLRFRYQGNSSSSNFDPYGICCDSSWNIIVADMKNDKIHLIDKDGAFLHHVTYDGIKMPRAIGIDENDSLYVGEWHTDTIKVIAR